MNIKSVSFGDKIHFPKNQVSPANVIKLMPDLLDHVETLEQINDSIKINTIPDSKLVSSFYTTIFDKKLPNLLINSGSDNKGALGRFFNLAFAISDSFYTNCPDSQLDDDYGYDFLVELQKHTEKQTGIDIDELRGYMVVSMPFDAANLGTELIQHPNSESTKKILEETRTMTSMIAAQVYARTMTPDSKRDKLYIEEDVFSPKVNLVFNLDDDFNGDNVKKGCSTIIDMFSDAWNTLLKDNKPTE